MTTSDQNRYRSLFISDLHLGSPHCKAGRALNFLRQTTTDRIYLVGDVLDHPMHLYNLPKLHRDVLAELIKKACLGTEIIYIPGNHDELFRNYIGYYGGIRIQRQWIHSGKDGRWYLVTHGDETDMLGLGRFLAVLVWLEKFVPIPMWEVLRRYFGTWIARHTEKYEKKMRKLVVGYYAGVICGHIHEPRISEGYMNTGDWVQHCTAIVEHHDGKFELLQG